MSNPPDYIKMLAVGRYFAIGSLYNYVEDVIIPNVRLWDPEDVSRLAIVKSKKKEAVTVHEMAGLHKDDEEESDGLELVELGMDDHLALSLTAGLMDPSFKGAWKYAVDRANWIVGRRDEVAVHCRCSTKKVSFDPTSQLEIICRPEKLIEATHVVVAITYGLEAFCLFSPQNNETEKMLDNARFFADRLVQGEIKLEPQVDDFNPLELECVLYSDLMKREQSWSRDSVSEQYNACRKVLDHPANKAVPLIVYLYPLSQLKLGNQTEVFEVSRVLLTRCQSMRNQLQQIHSETDSYLAELDQLERSNDLQWILPTFYERAKDFDRNSKAFIEVIREALSKWTVSVRRGDEKEVKMAEWLEAIENKLPFVPKQLTQWINHQKQQIRTLKMLGQLPGVRFVSKMEQLEIEFKNREFDLTVVLHLSSLVKVSDWLVDELKNLVHFVDLPSRPEERSWINGRNVKFELTSADRRLFFSAGQTFSDWVMIQGCPTKVQYFILYDDEPSDCYVPTPFIRLYDLSKLNYCTTFHIPKAPGEIVIEGNHRGVLKLSWTAEDTEFLTGYLVQYRNVDGTDENWESILQQGNKRAIKINYLQSEETYVFRVASVTQGGRSPFGPVSERVTIDPICPPPDRLQCRYATDQSITISWNHKKLKSNKSSDEKSFKISHYSIGCWVAGHQESTFIQRSAKTKTITLEPLVLDTIYCVEIRAVFTDDTGSNYYSPSSAILEAQTLKEPERAAHIVRRVSQKCLADSSIDSYRLPMKKHRGTPTPGVGHYVFGEPGYLSLAGKHRQRTILMLGATGSGKSTLINAMINYVLGIEWDDDFRFKLIDEPAEKSQAHSQTDLVTTYDLYEIKGSRLDYSLTVVDTPGFGDTRGLEKDKKIMEQLQKYFQCRHGIQQLEAVCFVVQSSLPRLTATQQYIFDSILSIFGQDIHNNIRLMVTFSDNALPPVLGAVKQAGIPSPMDPLTGLPLHNKFNNSIFFETKKSDRKTNEFNETYFDQAVEGFDRFFSDLSCMEAKSLTLTREVLEERKRLEALVEGLQMRTEMKLIRVDELEKIKKILTENKEQMESNTDFEFEALVPKSTDISGTGQFTTNCQKCRTTCHFPCRQASDENKHRCSVMDQQSGNCMICKCHWRGHFNQRFRYEMVKEKVTKSSDSIRQQYQEAVNESMTNEQLLDRIQRDIEKHERHLVELMQATYPCIKRLNEIALKPHPFSTPDYIDLMVAAEKQEHRQGYQQRIVTLMKLRQMAEITAKLIDDQSKVNRRMSSLSLHSKRSNSTCS